MDSDATVKLTPPAKKPKVLLVEDEVNIASMVEDWLSEKYDVIVASTGKAALEKAVSELPAIILQDINLPDMTGFDVVKLLEKDSRVNQTPVIFLTGEKMVEETVRFISTVKNVKGYVNKPFRLKDFLEKIDQIVSHKSEFVVLESRAASPQDPAKAELVREIRASANREAVAESKKIPVPPPVPSSRSAAMKKGGFFAAVFFGLFRALFWTLFLAAVAGGAAELACRAIERFTGDWTFLPPSMAPGSVWSSGGVTYRLNASGFRDLELVDRSPGSFHVMVLGGTSLFGRDVLLAETFSKRLEAQLNAEALFSPAGSNHVVHGALWGLSPAEQWAAYEGLHARLKPDLVIWAAGDPGVRVPSMRRFQTLAECPPHIRSWVERSRLARLLAMTYLHGEEGGDVASPVGGLADRVGRFLEGNPETFLVVLNMDKVDFVKGSATRRNLMAFNVFKVVAPDISWKGLSSPGHERLSRVLAPLLRRHAERIKPSSAPPTQKKERTQPLRPRRAR